MSLGTEKQPQMTFRDEWTLSKFSPRMENATWLATSPVISPYYLAGARLALAVFSLVALGISVAEETAGPKWFIYLTNWGFTLVTASAVGFFILTLLHIRMGQVYANEPPYTVENWQSGWRWYHSVQQILFSITASMAILISIFYYSLVPLEWTFVSVATHMINSVWTLLELLVLSNVKFNLLHAVYTMAFGTTYLVFNIIYTLNGGSDSEGHPYTYKVLQWNSKPGMAAGISVPLAYVGIPLIHMALFFACKLRVQLYNMDGGRQKLESTGSVASA